MPASAASTTNTFPPKHHPLGEYFSDFILPKVALYILSIFLVLMLCALRHPQVGR